MKKFNILFAIASLLIFAQGAWAQTQIEGLTYNEIAELTGASTATISRVNRALMYGKDGYRLVFDRLKEEETPQS